MLAIWLVVLSVLVEVLWIATAAIVSNATRLPSWLLLGTCFLAGPLACSFQLTMSSHRKEWSKNVKVALWTIALSTGPAIIIVWLLFFVDRYES